MADWDDNGDFGWGDDPFEGDINFDMDFDKPSKQGFFKSFVSGFLSGTVEHSIGSTDARINTLKMALPKSFTGTFSNLRDLNERRQAMMKDVKAESFGAVQDLQYLAKRAADRLAKTSPNKISNSLTKFSQNDFSSWEKTDSSTSESNPQMGDTKEEEINALIESQQATAEETQSAIKGVGREALSMMSQIGGRQIGHQAALGQAVNKTNNLLKQLLDHQRKVQAKADVMKLNLMARSYLTSVKYYEFAQASQHRVIDELKLIRAASQMSDYQKTTTSQFVRKNIRESVYSTAKSKFGGFSQLLDEKFGKNTRDDVIGGVGGAIGGIRMALEMSEGMPINVGQMAGNQLASALIKNIPKLIKTGKAQQVIGNFVQRYPQFAKRVTDAYAKATDFGHTSTYATGNYEEIVNTLAKHYQGGMSSFNEHGSYEEYAASLADGKKGLSKAQWRVLNTLGKAGNKLGDSVLSNVWNPSGTTFSMKNRTLADSHEQSLWTRRDSRTLTEEIPRWLGEIWATLEKTRTGDDSIKPMAYDYTKGKFLSNRQKVASVLNQVYNKSDFQHQANSSIKMAESIDTDKSLSDGARKAFAYRLAQDADRKLGFSPYNYLAFDDKDGVHPEHAEEIKRLMQTQFGITDQHINDFRQGTDTNRAAMLLRLPTKEGRERQVSLAETAKSLSRFTPDMSDRLDLLKSTGSYHTLVEAGVIKRDAQGNDSIDMDDFRNTLKKYIQNPDRQSAIMPEDDIPGATRYSGNRKVSSRPQGQSLDALSKTLTDGIGSLKEVLEKAVSTIGANRPNGTSDPMVITPLVSSMDKMNEQMVTLVNLANHRNEVLDRILARQPSDAKPDTQSSPEDQAAKAGKLSILERLKNSNLKGMFNKGVDALLDQQPLILGGLLGGLATVAFHDPKAAMLLGGGAAAALVYAKIRGLASGRSAVDTEDLYEEGSSEPLLRADKLANKNYWDMGTKAVVTSWGQITGAVKDLATGVVINAQVLAGKLFTKENKEVFLKGLSKVRDFLVKTWNVIDPFGRLTWAKDKIRDRFTSMDIYKDGESSPTLTRAGFRAGDYFRKDESGTFQPLKGWNEIDGPVYDRHGETLITQHDYDTGLKTSMGTKIQKLGAFGKLTGKLGLDLMGRVKAKLMPKLAGAKDAASNMIKADYSPIVRSVDRIYDLLNKHWGYDPVPHVLDGSPVSPGEVSAREEAEREEGQESLSLQDRLKNQLGLKDRKGRMPKKKVKEATQRDTGKTDDPNAQRLNSLEDQAKHKKEDKAEHVQDAIIDIAQNFGFGAKDPEKKKRSGLFGLLTSGFGLIGGAIGGISKFFTKTLWSGLKTLTKFANIGIKALPFIASGIGAVAKGLMTLLKTRSLSNAAGDFMESLGNSKDKRKRSADRRARRATPKGRFLSGGKKLGLGMAAGYAADWLVDSDLIDKGGLADKALGYGGTAATVVGGVQTASAIAAAAGIDIGVGTVVAGAGTVLGGAWTMAAPLLLNPVTLGAAAIGLAGYGIYKFITRGADKQYAIRMTQYGLNDPDSDLAKKILQAEDMLSKYVVIGNAKASINKDAPLKEVINLFLTDPNNKTEVGDVFSWFNGRFKPVYLTYMATLDAAKFKSLKDYDEAVSQDVYTIAKQVHQTLGSVQPYPYSIVAKIDPDQRLLAEKATVIRVNNLLEELKKYVDRKAPADNTSVVMPKSEGALNQEKKSLEAQLANPAKTGWFGMTDVNQQLKTQAKLNDVNKQLADLNGKFNVPQAVKDIYIKDLLPDDRPVDMLTGIRLAAYGNDMDLTWRVEAVLKLERYCESMFSGKGDNLSFSGKAGDLFGMFQDSFRLGKDDGEQWCLWFRDRFMPVMMNYVKLLSNYRNGNPGVVWKTLSVTARYEIAKGLAETKTTVGFFTVGIWKVRASPFKDSQSGDRPARVDRMLQILGEASKQAKIKDPEGEAGKTNISTWAATIAPHKVGGGLTDKAANVQTAAQAKTKGELALSGQFGTNTNRGAGTGNTYTANGLYGAAPNQYGFKALTGESDTSHLDMSGVQQSGTGKDDKGVSIPKQLAEQLIIRTMLKAGFTDPRQIAEMLALCNYESQGFTRTTENMNYSDPARLTSIFKEIRTSEQARQLIAQGPEAIANVVYGGKKGASLGNMNPGDGWKYRGRGLVQLTGAANYAKFGKAIGVDLLNNPDLASKDPNIMAEIAVQFFKDSKLLQSISSGNAFTKAATGLNGGSALPGMPQRASLYASYLQQLQNGTLGSSPATPDATGGAPQAGAPYPGTAGTTDGGSSSGGARSMYGGGNTPMLGSGNVPSPSPLAVGGPSTSVYSPAMSSSGTGSDDGSTPPLVGSNATAGSGLRLKSGETTGGGESHPGIKALADMLQKQVANFKQFTALNDLYHRRSKPNSKHAQGLAIDLTLTNGVASSDRAVATIKGIMGQAGMTPQEYLVINEYRTPSAGATGGHVHTQFSDTAAADKFLKASGAGEKNTNDPTAAPEDGGLTSSSMPPVAPSTSTGAGAGVTSDDSEDNSAAPTLPPTGTQVTLPGQGGNSGSGNAPSATPSSDPQGNNSRPASPTPTPTAPAAPDTSQALLAVLTKLQETMAGSGQSGTPEAALLKNISDQMAQLIDVTQKAGQAPQKRVGVGGMTT